MRRSKSDFIICVIAVSVTGLCFPQVSSAMSLGAGSSGGHGGGSSGGGGGGGGGSSGRALGASWSGSAAGGKEGARRSARGNYAGRRGWGNGGDYYDSYPCGRYNDDGDGTNPYAWDGSNDAGFSAQTWGVNGMEAGRLPAYAGLAQDQTGAHAGRQGFLRGDYGQDYSWSDDNP